MIERVSRYYDGPLSQTAHKYTGNPAVSVYRAFPTSKQVQYVEYTWADGDSIAILAQAYGLGSKYWWEILEINPEIDDPFNIAAGTILRVPYGND
jgi:hypothetical protein